MEIVDFVLPPLLFTAATWGFVYLAQRREQQAEELHQSHYAREDRRTGVRPVGYASDRPDFDTRHAA